MTTLAYFDCPTGIAGDMCLGALIDAGVPLEYLIEQLDRLGLSHEYRLWAEPVHHNGLQATKVHVDLSQTAPQPPSHEQLAGVDYAPSFDRSHLASHAADSTTHSAPAHAHPHPPNLHSDHGHPQAGHDDHSAADRTDPHDSHGTRHLSQIQSLIRSAQLPTRAETWSLAVFRRLAEAEGAVHGISPDHVHFHEVGAIDAIVDIVGTCLGLDWLGVDELYCSALPTGGGTVWAAHGRIPVPAPAVLKLWEMRQIPIYSNGIQRELVTPTGAAIATTLATAFGAPPAMMLKKVGLGAGGLSLPIPNILRLWIGEASETGQRSQSANLGAAPISTSGLPAASETIAVLETQVDDLSPQAIGYVLEQLLTAGALDVFTQAIGMKKSRPGVLLTVICRPQDIETCETILFQETTTLGIRRQLCQRHALDREIQAVKTPHGTIRVKIARQPKTGTILNVQPEYEDCAQIARHAQLPWRDIHQSALLAWQKQTLTAKTATECECGS